MITSTGTIGTDFNRSEGRAYLTIGEIIGSGIISERFQELDIPLSEINKSTNRHLVIFLE